jgi:NAD(P)-dependent dehydrogenase (short-subunit alcohol dehydrogenase family)
MDRKGQMDRRGQMGRSAMNGGSSRVVLITGASSGIGRATALLAAGRGDHLVLLARGEGPLADIAQECEASGAASVMVLAADVADDAAVHRAVAAVLDRHGALDAVVHSAGVVAYGRLPDVPTDVFDHVVRTDLLGSANVARAVLPSMRDRDHGHLVLLGSLLGQMAPPYMSAYAVSKWGVRALARILVIENRDRRGVHVSLVSPGGVDTPIYLQAANYLGQVGRPPPPVLSPEKVARVVIRTIDRPKARVQVGAFNPLMIFGFSALPGLFDSLVRPLFEVAATDARQSVGAGTGNVFSSVADGNRLRGAQGNPVRSIVAGVWRKLRGHRQ